MPRGHAAKDKLLDAAMALIREKGFAATTVDELCGRAGVTKGAFFHYFESKEELGCAAADHWSAMTRTLFARAAYHDHDDPLDRVLGYIDLRRSLMQGELPEYTCVVGTLVQETYGMHACIRDACAACIFGHVATLVDDIEQAMASRGVGENYAGEAKDNWSAESLAAHMQGVLQGAFILAKAKNDVTVAIESVDHLRRYVELLFRGTPKPKRTNQAKKAKRAKKVKRV